jgi:starvation-inducible DNA-binding protein
MENNLEKELNQLLSDYHIFYQNLRGFHWNIKGKNFFELHVKFEEYYTEALTTIDEIAERILTIGGSPLHTFEDYQKLTNLSVFKDVSNDEDSVHGVNQQLSQLIDQENVVKDLASQAGDNETEDMMIGLINTQQKTRWMLHAWLGQTA